MSNIKDDSRKIMSLYVENAIRNNDSLNHVCADGIFLLKLLSDKREAYILLCLSYLNDAGCVRYSERPSESNDYELDLTSAGADFAEMG